VGRVHSLWVDDHLVSALKMMIDTKLKELLKLPGLTVNEKCMFEDFLTKLTSMLPLSRNQIRLVSETYEKKKRMRLVGNTLPYYKPPPKTETSWDKIGGEGLQRQLDLLGVTCWNDAVKVVAKYSDEERALWFTEAERIAQ